MLPNPAEKAFDIKALIVRQGNISSYSPDGLVIELYNPTYRKIVLNSLVDSELMTLGDDQTITGAIIFTQPVTAPDPVSADQLTTKRYVDDNFVEKIPGATPIFETTLALPTITINIPLTASIIYHNIRGVPAPMQLSGIVLKRRGNIVSFTMPGQDFGFTGTMDWIYFENILPVGWRPTYRSDVPTVTRYDGAAIAPAYWEIQAASEATGRVALYWTGPYVAGPVSTFNDMLIEFEL